MQKRGVTFGLVYLAYVALLAVLVTAAVLYVRDVLAGYESAQPERYVRDTIARLAEEAGDGSLLGKYGLPSVVPGEFEKEQDPQAAYLSLYTDGNVSYFQTGGSREAGVMTYLLQNGDYPLAEIKLKTVGEPVTKLGILTSQDWAVEEVKPLLEARDYTLTVPTTFRVSVNGVELTEEHGTPEGSRRITYRVSGLYLKPEFTIVSPEGKAAGYTIKDGKVLPSLYDYMLTLPDALTVTVNGSAVTGEAQENGMVRYDLISMEKPEVKISDRFGNTVDYEGGNKLPLTYLNITAVGCTVQVEGRTAAADASVDTADFVHFKDYVTGLPQTEEYHIAVLKDNAQVTVTDRSGKPVELKPGSRSYDLTGPVNGLDAVPESVGAEIDVLDVAHKWSLMMSNDLRFAALAPCLLEGSYQYDVAYKYAISIDITFISNHVLLDPTFTEETVGNFAWITDDCFSVDISFVKHMRLKDGQYYDDPMRDRFYFVRYNDAWKLAGIKEVLDDGTE